ncbi:hypothetical protein SHLA_15c000450 [Shinella sp. DD12]|nr:hypothetical protein SHLA_15c000450 [Shinella sp. DD12]
MPGIQLTKRLLAASISSCILATSGLAACNLDPIEFESYIDSSGGSGRSKVWHRFEFVPQPSTKVRVDHTFVVHNDLPDIYDRVHRSLSPLPDDECGAIAKYEGVNVGVRPPSLSVVVDFSATKWGCVSADLPCPTLQDLARTCTQQAKTRLGSGNGWVQVLLNPRVVDDQVSFTQQESFDFKVSDETRFLGTLIGQTTGGVLGAAAFNVLANHLQEEVKRQITVPSFSNTTDLTRVPGYYPKTTYAGFVRESQREDCRVLVPAVEFGGIVLFPEQKYCFPVVVAEMQVTRTGLVKGAHACFLREILGGSEGQDSVDDL